MTMRVPVEIPDKKTGNIRTEYVKADSYHNYLRIREKRPKFRERQRRLHI
jgi:hypothetical protein